ncbi:MAG: 3'-5' exonuclease, partial [Gemmatimonadota bacterium]
LLAAAELAPELDVPTGGARALADFAAGISALAELARAATVEEVLREAVRSFGFVAALESEEDGAERIANLTELLAAAAAFDPAEVEDGVPDATDLELYLQTASLRTDLDEVDDSESAVTLMTLHNAKGLEYPVVFVVGLEEGLFPLSRSMETDEGLEEERRLFYVGITRAEDELFLSHADRRWRYGNESGSAPSSFLGELPDSCTECRRLGRRTRVGSMRRRPSNRGLSFGWQRDAQASKTAATGRDAGLRYDFSDSQEDLRIEAGVTVLHPEFGQGRILSVSGQGRQTKAEIDFGSAGTRKVMVAYAGLRPA